MAKIAKGPAAIPVAFDLLTSLLGKTIDDPDVQVMLKTAGKVTVKPDYVIAKEAGFDYSLDRRPDVKKKVLSTLFLYADGKDKHRGYADLPEGFAFTSRDELLAMLPEPKQSWKLGKGKVPVSTPGVSHDTWDHGGVEIAAMYSQTHIVGHFNVTQPEEARGGRSFSTPAYDPPEHDAYIRRPLV